MLTVSDYAAHARDLAKAFKVRLIEDSSLDGTQAYALPAFRMDPRMLAQAIQTVGSGFVGAVVTAPVASERTYSTALHEIGHLVSPTGHLQFEKAAASGSTSRSYTMLEEESAWEWAQHYALHWTPEMEADKQEALASYRRGHQGAEAFEAAFGGAQVASLFGGLDFSGLAGPVGPPAPVREVDPNAGQRMAPTHRATARSIVCLIKKGTR